MRILPVAAVAPCLVAIPSAQSSEKLDLATIAQIRDEGLQRSQVMDHISWLADVYGPRMTRTPRTLPAGALVRDAVTMVREFRQDEIPVVGPSGEPVGILDVQDLIAMRLVKD